MKKITAIAIVSGSYNREFEETIKKKDTNLKDGVARKNGRHFASRNLPAPIGDHLQSYIGELKTGYEELVAFIYQFLQPASHFPEARMDADFAIGNENHLDNEIKKLDDKNRNDEYELGKYHPGGIPMRMWIAGIATFIIGIGEVLFNTKAFQVTGENMLFALILSISVSFSVFVFSHVAPFLFKSVKTTLHRRLVFWGSLFIIIGLFTALAIFRSRYLATHEVYVSPVYFVIINLFFFLVSALLSFFILPSWQEIKENLAHLKLHYALLKNKKILEQLILKKEELKRIELEKNKQRIRMAHYAEYTVERVKKMYKESVEIFKSTNLAYRTDRQLPDCFKEETLEMQTNNPIVFYSTDKEIGQ